MRLFNYFLIQQTCIYASEILDLIPDSAKLSKGLRVRKVQSRHHLPKTKPD